MAAHVTRCPHCRTTFRVKDEHLKVAKGAVRCGSCLQVFKAAEHFVDEQQLQTKPPSAAPKQQTGKPSPAEPKAAPQAKEQLIHDDMDDDDIDDDVLISDDGLIHDDMDVEEDDNEQQAFSDDPLVDFNIRAPEKQDRPAPRNDLEIDASVLELKNASADTLDLVDPDADSYDLSSSKDPDEAWADALLDDDEEIEEITLGGLDLSDTGQFDVNNSDDEFSQFKAGAEADDFQGFADDDDNFHLGEDEFGGQVTEIPVSGQGISELQEDPLQLAAAKNNRGGISWGWAIASLMMLVVAASQTLYFKFDQWSRTPQWRPYYSQICELAGCQLPDVQNIQQLSTQHLVVRSHPKLQKALVVDTLMQNHANYQQPFPDLELVFSDLNDNVVASRRFIPTEYLSGELAGQQLMPSHTPIHIALEIVDPGPEAVSYAIRLQANQ